ncbi:hypothetical protein L1887_48445 [Cichorium endivia]|nr:hypothetical protein L1887_48445 [Cichorium endivia]
MSSSDSSFSSSFLSSLTSSAAPPAAAAPPAGGSDGDRGTAGTDVGEQLLDVLALERLGHERGPDGLNGRTGSGGQLDDLLGLCKFNVGAWLAIVLAWASRKQRCRQWQACGAQQQGESRAGSRNAQDSGLVEKANG